MSVRSMLRDSCTIRRRGPGGTDDGWTVQPSSTLVTGVACQLQERGGREKTTAGEFTIATDALYLLPGTAIETEDQVEVTLRDGTVRKGRVVAVSHSPRRQVYIRADIERTD